MHLRSQKRQCGFDFINYIVDKITKADVETDNSAAIITEDSRGSLKPKS